MDLHYLEGTGCPRSSLTGTISKKKKKNLFWSGIAVAEIRYLVQEGLGTMKGIQAKLVVELGVIPEPRPVPYALLGAIEQDLDQLEELGVLEKIGHSNCAAPVVPVLKADGSIRICRNCKVTVNPILQVNQFPMP